MWSSEPWSDQYLIEHCVGKKIILILDSKGGVMAYIKYKEHDIIDWNDIHKTARELLDAKVWRLKG